MTTINISNKRNFRIATRAHTHTHAHTRTHTHTHVWEGGVVQELCFRVCSLCVCVGGSLQTAVLCVSVRSSVTLCVCVRVCACVCGLGDVSPLHVFAPASKILRARVTGYGLRAQVTGRSYGHELRVTERANKISKSIS